MTTAPLIEVEDLRIDLDAGDRTVPAVEGVSFRIARGETFGLVGESGCGKSISALSLIGLLRPPLSIGGGKILFEGKEIQHLSAARQRELRGNRIAMIFQEPMTALNPAYTIGDQLMEGYLRHKGGSAAAALTRAVQLLEKVGIASAGERLRQYPHQLSGGLRQRVMIAMALMCDPDLLIADEPTTALDVTIQTQILRLLADLQRELGIALVLITHDLGIVARIAHRVAVMYAGEIVEAATADALFRDPRHPYTRGLIGCIPVPGRTWPGETLGVIPGVVPSLIGDLRGCAFRDRCGFAQSGCALRPPDRRDADAHEWRCVLEAA
jgi:peptide/nickel transport system ATP-binding protein